jgi:hypothetical protein
VLATVFVLLVVVFRRASDSCAGPLDLRGTCCMLIVRRKSMRASEARILPDR